MPAGELLGVPPQSGRESWPGTTHDASHGRHVLARETSQGVQALNTDEFKDFKSRRSKRGQPTPPSVKSSKPKVGSSEPQSVQGLRACHKCSIHA